jgi:hypothetical protein
MLFFVNKAYQQNAEPSTGLIILEFKTITFEKYLVNPLITKEFIRATTCRLMRKM